MPATADDGVALGGDCLEARLAHEAVDREAASASMRGETNREADEPREALGESNEEAHPRRGER
jgi:hypothetical protein